MTLKLAVAGVGAIGRAHAERIAASRACELLALVDPAPAARPQAEHFGVPLHGDLEALLAGPRPDGVVLATPNALHVDGALRCLRAGVPVLVEKPIADRLDDAQRLVQAQAACGVPVLVGHHRRHSAILATAVEVVRSGRLGRLVAISGNATFVKPDSYFTEGPWRARPGGGPLLINGIHEIDSLRALAGEIVAVQAFASNAVRGFAVEDSAAIVLRFAGGAIGTLLLSDTAASPHSWEHTSGENPRYDHHDDQDCYLLCGTQGSLQVPTMREYGYAGQRSWFEPMQRSRLAVPQVDPLAAQLAHFCAVVRGEARPLVDAASALRSLRATLAVSEAAASGRTVTLN